MDGLTDGRSRSVEAWSRDNRNDPYLIWTSVDHCQRDTFVNLPFKSVNQLISWNFQILSLYHHQVVLQKRSILRKPRINAIRFQVNDHLAGDYWALGSKLNNFGMQDCNNCLKQIVWRRCLGGSISKMDSKNISLTKRCQRKGSSNHYFIFFNR